MTANPAYTDLYELRTFSGAERDRDAMSVLRRFSALHAECVETCRHARLLSRTPAAAAALVLGCATVLALSASSVSPIMLGVWAFFVLAGAAGMLLIARQSDGAAFELLSLRPFAIDLHAMLLYAGFAWGAGAFLAIPAGGSALALDAYAGAGVGVLALLLRGTTPILCFLIPAALLSACAALFSYGDPAAAALILGISLVLGGTSALAERRQTRRMGLLPAPARP